MAKWNSSNVTYQGLKYIVDNADKLIVCKGQPGNYAGAIDTATNKIGSWAMTTGTGAGADYDITFGANNSAILEVKAQSSIVADSTGGADHVALICVGLTTLVYVTSLSATQTVSSTGNKMNVSTWAITLKDAT